MTLSAASQTFFDGTRFIQCLALSKTEEELFQYESIQRKFCLASVQLANIQTSEEVMQRVGTALNFPSYFGGNWDAFLDMLTDLSWTPAPRYVVLLRNAEALLQLPTEHLGIFLRLCSAVVARWQSGEDEEGKPVTPTPFYFFLEGQASFCRLIADLLVVG